MKFEIGDSVYNKHALRITPNGHPPIGKVKKASHLMSLVLFYKNPRWIMNDDLEKA